MDDGHNDRFACSRGLPATRALGDFKVIILRGDSGLAQKTQSHTPPRQSVSAAVREEEHAFQGPICCLDRAWRVMLLLRATRPFATSVRYQLRSLSLSYVCGSFTRTSSCIYRTLTLVSFEQAQRVQVYRDSASPGINPRIEFSPNLLRRAIDVCLLRAGNGASVVVGNRGLEGSIRAAVDRGLVSGQADATGELIDLVIRSPSAPTQAHIEALARNCQDQDRLKKCEYPILSVG